MRKAKETYTDEQKQAAVVDLALREGSAQEVAHKHGVTRAALYKWRSDLLGKERPMNTPKRKKPDSGQDEAALKDRKSTRLNSSHVAISYAVFCLKKKNVKNADHTQ